MPPRVGLSETEEEEKKRERVYLQAVLQADSQSGNPDSNKYHILPSVTKWGLQDVELIGEKIREQSRIRIQDLKYIRTLKINIKIPTVPPSQSKLYVIVYAQEFTAIKQFYNMELEL